MKRLFYIDNLRIILISLVVLHHLAITYGAPGDWFYNETEAGFPEVIPMAMFVATNQAFFMGMFFFISALFVIPSLLRKGVKRYIADRFLRLGIPLLVFYFLLGPLTVFIRNKLVRGEEPSFTAYLLNGWGRGPGPLWFVEALLLFSCIYLLFRKIRITRPVKAPSMLQIFMTATFVGFCQFIIRTGFPVGWNIPVVGFQVAFFVQYIFLFIFGIVAYRNNWLESVNFRMAKTFLIVAGLLVFIGFPALFFLGGAQSGNIGAFMGGLTWQSFFYSLWEQLTGFSLIAGLLGLGQKYLNHQGRLTGELSGSAYGVFVFHAPVIVLVGSLLAWWKINPLLKFIALAPVALAACFLVAWLVRKVPGVKRVL